MAVAAEGLAATARSAPALPAAGALLTVDGLSIAFADARGAMVAVDGLSYAVARGETLAVVGESGSGKTLAALALLGLVPRPGAITRGALRLHRRDGGVVDLARADAATLRSVRGNEIAMIFQEPMTALNPTKSIGDQVAEPLQIHRGLGRRAARDRAVELLDRVGIAEPRRRADSFPHQLSGGMRQRAMIAMALACEPLLLIADEPTTALDVTIQAQIVDLIAEIKRDTGMAVLFITHDLGLVADVADRVLVMYAGCAVESQRVGGLFAMPRHPYTRGLLGACPRPDRRLGRRARLATIGGGAPTPGAWPAGCRFHPRCESAQPGRCDGEAPAADGAGDVMVRCARWRELAP